MKPIGRRIRERRVALNMPRCELARLTNLLENWIADYEDRNCVTYHIPSLQAIADALDCDLVVKLKPRHEDAARHEKADDFYTGPGEGVVSIGVDYGAPAGDRTESVGIIRLGDQTLTAPVQFIDEPGQS